MNKLLLAVGVVSEQLAAGISLYPHNPSNGTVYVQASAGAMVGDVAWQVSLYDLSGKLVLPPQSVWLGSQLDVSRLATATYFYTLARQPLPQSHLWWVS